MKQMLWGLTILGIISITWARFDFSDDNICSTISEHHRNLFIENRYRGGNSHAKLYEDPTDPTRRVICFEEAKQLSLPSKYRPNATIQISCLGCCDVNTSDPVGYIQRTTREYFGLMTSGHCIENIEVVELQAGCILL